LECGGPRSHALRGGHDRLHKEGALLGEGIIPGHADLPAVDILHLIRKGSNNAASGYQYYSNLLFKVIKVVTKLVVSYPKRNYAIVFHACGKLAIRQYVLQNGLISTTLRRLSVTAITVSNSTLQSPELVSKQVSRRAGTCQRSES